MPYYESSHGTIAISLTMEQAKSCAFPGQNDEAVKALSDVPKVREQLDSIDREELKEELREYGAWDDGELADHEQNLQRFLWLAAWSISEGDGKQDDES